jgi:hypothetical protein
VVAEATTPLALRRRVLVVRSRVAPGEMVREPRVEGVGMLGRRVAEPPVVRVREGREREVAVRVPATVTEEAEREAFSTETEPVGQTVREPATEREAEDRRVRVAGPAGAVSEPPT